MVRCSGNAPGKNACTKPEGENPVRLVQPPATTSTGVPAAVTGNVTFVRYISDGGADAFHVVDRK